MAFYHVQIMECFDLAFIVQIIDFVQITDLAFIVQITDFVKITDLEFIIVQIMADRNWTMFVPIAITRKC